MAKKTSSLSVCFLGKPVTCNLVGKGGFKSEDTEEYLHCQHEYSKSLSWAENFNFPPKTVNNLFKFSAHDSYLEYLFWRDKDPPLSSDLKPPSGMCKISK